MVKTIGTFVILLIPFLAQAQFATREISKKKQEYVDSLKQVEYNYTFPFLGQGAYKAGFDIPYPAGIMGNYMFLSQGIRIDNMQLGLKTSGKDIPLTNVDDLIKFGSSSTEAYTFTVRPDLWVFPFLNVYGLLGYGKSTTNVQLIEPVPINSTVEQGVTTMGFGIMGAFGIGPLWASFDGNWTWNKPELLDKMVNVRVFGVRVGKSFEFKNHPQRNIAIWVGAMRARMQTETLGQITLGEALPQEVWDKKDQFIADYNTWYDGLPPWKQAVVDQSPLPAIIDWVDMVDGSSIITYGMDKQVVQEWNGIFGAQFQFNKRWMLRTEWGLIGDRKSGLVSLNYRFLL